MSSIRMSLMVAGLAILMVASAATAQRTKLYTAPEAFTSELQGKTAAGVLAGKVRIQIDKYTSEVDRKMMIDALTTGGYPKFLEALRAAPVVGGIEIGDQKFTLRWARERTTEKGRTITLVTESPIYFIGGGRADAKPRAGFEIAVVTLTVDDFGLGTGRMAAAAKVKPDGNGGVVLEDYADEPVRLSFVSRVRK